MVEGKLTKALENVNMTYDDLVNIANEMVNPYIEDINALVNNAYDNINNLTNDYLRNLLIRLSIKSFSFSEIKEKSILKSECAETLRKEKYAIEFNKGDGTVAFKENNALVNSSEEVLVELIYELISSIFKTKLDEVHRLVDTIKTIIMSRNAEEKLSREIVSD